MNAGEIAVGSIAVLLFAGPSPALAQPGTGRAPVRQQMTCGEFLQSDDLAKPEIVYWLATRGGAGVGNAAIDADATDGMVPALVEYCKDAPTALLSQQVKAKAERLRRGL